MTVHSGFAAALIAALATTASAQDVVRLKNGRTLSGTIVIDPANKDGFKLVRWDTSATLLILWSQVPDAEKRRLLHSGVDLPPPSLALGDTIDGIRIVTSGRELIGVVVKENDSNLMVKTAASASPVPIAVGGIVAREDVKIHEADAYSPDEMIARRTQGLSDGDSAKWVDVGKFAQALKLFDKAKEFFLKAAGGDATKDAAIAALIDENTRLSHEEDAQKALASAKKLAEETQYEKAIEELQKMLETFADTETAKGVKPLLAELEKENQEFKANRAKILGKKVPELWASIRSSMWEDQARMKKWADASRACMSMDAELLKKVCAKLNCTPEEAEGCWAKREKKSRTVSPAASSWIVTGGIDGGSDLVAIEKGKADPVDDFIDKFGKKEGASGGRGGTTPKGPKDQEKELGKPLQTAEEWWTAAASSSRRTILEASYAMTSTTIEKDEPVKKACSTCKEQGTLHISRGGKNIEVHCPRCHGAKDDVSITYR